MAGVTAREESLAPLAAAAAPLVPVLPVLPPSDAGLSPRPLPLRHVLQAPQARKLLVAACRQRTETRRKSSDLQGATTPLGAFEWVAAGEGMGASAEARNRRTNSNCSEKQGDRKRGEQH